jgi:hypothetical protein
VALGRYIIQDNLHIEALLAGFCLQAADLHPETPFIGHRAGSRYSTLVCITASIDVKPLNRHIVLVCVDMLLARGCSGQIYNAKLENAGM